MNVYTQCSGYASYMCPCELAEKGKCIVCSMCRGEELCSCSDTVSYCIMQELFHNNGQAKAEAPTLKCKIISTTEFDRLFLSYTFCYVAVLITHIIYARRVSGEKEFFRFDYLLFISKRDRIPDENIMECRVHSIDECLKASRDVYSFCKSKGVDMQKVIYLSLATEEVTTISIMNNPFFIQEQKILYEAENNV